LIEGPKDVHGGKGPNDGGGKFGGEKLETVPKGKSKPLERDEVTGSRKAIVP